MAGSGPESHGAVLVERFLDDLHAQLQSQENLRDFLLWWGGSLEYWIHITATTVGSRHGNVVRSEIPYRTRSRPKGAKPAQEELWTKWADGAVLLEGEVGVLIEVKCAPCRREIGTPLYDVGRYDLPALAGCDLEETLTYWHPDERVHDADWVSYTDPSWRELRQMMTSWWGLAILLVHGPSLHQGLDDLVQLKIENGIRNLELDGAPMPETAQRLRSVQKIERRDIQADAAVGALFGWALPLARSG